jgi:hypothetical protein
MRESLVRRDEHHKYDLADVGNSGVLHGLSFPADV